MTAALAVLGATVSSPVYSAPASLPVYNWTGCYVGAGAGYGMWNQDTAKETSPGLVILEPSLTSGGRGWFGQGQAGCDYQFSLPLSFWSPSFVIGALVDYEWAGSGFRGTLSGPANVAIFGAETTPWTWAAGARVGLLVTPQIPDVFRWRIHASELRSRELSINEWRASRDFRRCQYL